MLSTFYKTSISFSDKLQSACSASFPTPVGKFGVIPPLSVDGAGPGSDANVNSFGTGVYLLFFVGFFFAKSVLLLTTTTYLASPGNLFQISVSLHALLHSVCVQLLRFS